MTSLTNLPDTIQSEAELDDLLAQPYPELGALLRRLDGDIAILGIGGKMGLSLGAIAVRAMRAAGVTRKVYGISRFSDATAVRALEQAGVIPVRCDLLDRAAVSHLPQTANVIFMAGRKFGTAGEEELTWAMNTVAPAYVAEHYGASRIVAFSTGCVYPLISLARGGSVETDRPEPVGEYGQSCLGRERTFGYFSRKNQTPVCLLRLNYALDLRYGVLHDIAQAIWEGRPVDRTVGYFNAIWQGDANNQALLALAMCATPAAVLNLTGPELISVTEVAEEMARLLGKPVTFPGEAGTVGYLSNAGLAHRTFGYPRVSLAHAVRWTADWIKHGGRTFGKPTHFEVANGKF